MQTFETLSIPLLNRGWIPIPLAGKYPHVKWKSFKRRFPYLTEVQQWSHDYSGSNVGIVTGAASGVAAIDFNESDTGRAIVLYEIAKEVFPETRVVRNSRFPHSTWFYSACRLTSLNWGNILVGWNDRQIASFGTNPVTGVPYEYPYDSIIDCTPNHLPTITLNHIKKFLELAYEYIERPPLTFLHDGRLHPRVDHRANRTKIVAPRAIVEQYGAITSEISTSLPLDTGILSTYQKFLMYCNNTAASNGELFISQKSFAKDLGVSQMCVSKYIRKAKEHGMLVEVAGYIPHIVAKRYKIANSYFLLDSLSDL
jgi:hypothetical protein